MNKKQRQARAAMRLHHEKGLSLREAWRRVRRNPDLLVINPSETLGQFVRQRGGIRGFERGRWAAELAELPLTYRRRTGQPLDTLTEEAKARGLLPAGADESDMIDALRGGQASAESAEAAYEREAAEMKASHEAGELDVVRSIRRRVDGSHPTVAEWKQSGYVRSNPATAAQLDRAAKFYETFHGVQPKRTRRLRGGPGAPAVLVAMGDLRAVTYEPSRGERRRTWWEHVFSDSAILATDPEGRNLYIIPKRGGRRFRVLPDRGITG